MRVFSMSLWAMVLLAAACEERRPGADWHSESRELYHGIHVLVSFEPADAELAERVWRSLEDVDGVFNIHRRGSEAHLFNEAAAHVAISPSANFMEAVTLAKEMHSLTGGAFDPSAGPLVALWREAAAAGREPTEEAIERALGPVGMENVRVDADGTLTKLWADVALDFGGIVKGMAVDDSVEIIRRSGARSALVQVGGETAAFGLSPRGRPFVIGVQHPRDLSAIWTLMANGEEGVSAATSGNYRQPLTIGGREYYHIVDPSTGMPVDTRVLSATVVFPGVGRNGEADALSTAAAVMGPERALSLVERMGGEALFLIERDGEIVEVRSAGWDRFAAPGP